MAAAMFEALRSVQAARQATTFNEAGVPLSFGDDAAALAATQAGGVALYDASHWGRIEVRDADRLNFLHNQSTNTLKQRQPGDGCDTVFVTSTARTIDLATAYILEDAVLLSVSPGAAAGLIKFLDRYIFFADKVKLQDVTADTVMFELIGPASAAIVTQLGVADLFEKSYGSHQTVDHDGMTIRLAVGTSLSQSGFRIIASAHDAAKLWATLVELGTVPLGETVWETLRLGQGRPMPGAELTEDFNPLEAGLWHTISFDKGCYIGQETIARLETYNGVKQQLWGFHLPQAVEVGTIISIGDRKVGQVTSIRPTAEGCVGLGYVKTKAGGAGLEVSIGDMTTQLENLPYLTREKQV